MKKFLPNNLLAFRLANGFNRNYFAPEKRTQNVKIDLLANTKSDKRSGLVTIIDEGDQETDAFFDEF